MIAVRIDAPARLRSEESGSRLADVCAASVSMALSSVIALTLFATLPLLWGWDSYTVTSGSMGPLLRRGDVVVAAPSDGRNLALRTVIVIAPEGGRDDAAGTTTTPVTHRIVERLPDGRYRTKGDANPGLDNRIVAPGEVLGTLRVAVPMAGWPALMAQGEFPEPALPGGLRLMPLIGAVVLGALIAAIAPVGGRRKKEDDDEDDDPPPAVPGPRPGLDDELPRRRRRFGLRLSLVGMTALALVVAGAPLTAAVMTGKTTTASNSFASRAAFYPQAVIASGPVSYWRLGESNAQATMVDEMGVAPMTRTGDVQTGQTPGAVNKDRNTAMRFGTSGTNGYATTGASPSAALAIGGPLTVAAWFKTSNAQTNTNRLVTKYNGNNSNGNINYMLAFTSTGAQMRFLVDSNTGGSRTVASSPSSGYNDGAWHFAVGVYDGTNVLLYMDGAVVHTLPFSGSAPLRTVAADPVTISYQATPMTGVQVDEVAIWSKALTATQIGNLYTLATT